MTFDYGYRDSTNARLTGTIAAPSRDEAYRILKEKGIKPVFVTPAKGFANRILALGKRGWSIIVLCALCLVLGAVALEISRRARASRAQQQAESSAPLTRRQIYGDPALMERLQLENYASVFAEEGDRVLAHFAQPALIDRTVAKLKKDAKARAEAAKALAALGGRDCPNCVGTGTSESPSDAFETNASTRERKELFRIVLWMRSELSAYLADGTGTPESYLSRLLERQRYESEVYVRAKRELANEKDPAVYERRNDELRAIGAPTIPLPLSEDE